MSHLPGSHFDACGIFWEDFNYAEGKTIIKGLTMGGRVFRNRLEKRRNFGRVPVVIHTYGKGCGAFSYVEGWAEIAGEAVDDIGRDARRF